MKHSAACRRVRTSSAARLAFLLLLIPACTGSPETPERVRGVEGFPLTIENCGHTTTYETPPERAVPFDQNLTETLLALGLEDKIATFARQHFVAGEPVLEEFKDEYEELELISEGGPPSKEQLLSVEPDFVYVAFPYEMSEQEGMSRESLESLGISTHVQEGECGDEPVTFERHQEDIRQIGRIFDVEDRAEELIRAMNEDLDATRDLVQAQDAEPVKVFIFDSGAAAPLSAGGTGMTNAIIDAAGGVNIFEDVQERYPEVSWEEVVARNPDVIVTMDYTLGDPPAGQAQRDLLNQRLSSTTAIQQDRVVTMALIGFFPSIRNPDTVRSLARYLHPDLG